MYAIVALDIPDIKHQGFDYKIPSYLLNSLEIGCRVIVPLGNRLTQGFVIGLIPISEQKNVKEIVENLDIMPPITNELIELARWMSRHYSTHLFRTLQILIPPALKSKVEELILANGNINSKYLSEDEILVYQWIKERQPVQQTILVKKFPDKKEIINRMLIEKILEIKKEYRDENKRKILKVVKLNISKQQLKVEAEKLASKAKKQKEILEYIIENNIEDIDLTQLMKSLHINISTIKTLAKKGIFIFVDKKVNHDPFKDRLFEDKKVILTNEQEFIINKVIGSLKKQDLRPALLYGVTGSGKTEIYLNLIEHVLNTGKDSIVLVPEISLTSQMIERFKGRFGDNVAILHSRLSRGEKLDEWLRLQRGDAKIVIGARSAIFAPFKNIGLIILDEEHETSYKQEEHPKYHTREIAKWRANYNGALVLLGSATPSIESYYNAITNKYTLLELPNRIMGRPMPSIELVDMREELKQGNRSMFSQQLQDKISDCLDKGEQIILFLNRRGHSTFVMCRSCGFVMKCPNCEISLTYHNTNGMLRCHYCGYAVKEPKVCPECNSMHIRYFGTGTQKVEEELTLKFPGIRIIRMDVDSTNKKGAHDKLLSSFKRREADILLGTQMIAKGLDFESVTLVGVMAADTTLRLPDFRAAERTFQLLTQVSGRAGRHHLLGNVVIQTYTPEHYSIQYASNHDYQGFFENELKQRNIMGYPPYLNLILVHFTHEIVSQAVKASQIFVRELKKVLPKGVEISDPVISPISRIKNRNRFQCMIKFKDGSDVIPIINKTMINVTDILKDRRLQISIDLDPYILM